MNNLTFKEMNGLTFNKKYNDNYHVLVKNHLVGEIYCWEDSFYRFTPSPNMDFNEYYLEEIAKKLHELNDEYKIDIDLYLTFEVNNLHNFKKGDVFNILKKQLVDKFKISKVEYKSHLNDVVELLTLLNNKNE